jgi:hypothetical protein
MAKATRSISVVERRFALATLLNVYSAAWRNTGTDVCHISLDGRRILRKKHERMATRQSSRDRNLRQSLLSSAVGGDNQAV